MTSSSLAQSASHPAKARRRTQLERRSEAERRMLQAATALVAEKGLSALTLAAVGVAAGYSRGLPTHHFKTRARLLSTLTESITHSYIGRVQRHVSGRSALEDLLAAIDYYLADVARTPTLWRAFFAIANAALTDPDAAAAVSQVNARAITAFENRIKAAMSARQTRPGLNARTEAALILATLRGMAALMLTDPRNSDLPRARKALSSSVLRNLKAERP